MTKAKVNKLQESRKETNHKLKSLRQKLMQRNDDCVFPLVDLSGEEVSIDDPENDVRKELAILRNIQNVEDERVRRLVHGTGQGRPKSPAFEFAARTILATGSITTFVKSTYCITFCIFVYTRLFCARG
jgi:hypothetical protein